MRTHPSLSGRPSRLLRACAAFSLVTLFAVGLAAEPASSAPRAASVSRPEFVPGRVLVRFAGGAGRLARDAALRRVDGARVGTVYGEPTAILRLPDGASVQQAAATLRSTPGVAWASPDGVARVAGPPNDPKFPQQYALKNTGSGGGLADADVDAPEGWLAAGMSPSYPTSGGMKIGFVDTGIDTAHTEFAGKIKGCVHIDSGGNPVAGCKDGFGHGTHVAGIAAALTNNSTGVAGVSFDSPMWVCKALDNNGSGPDSSVAACINWLVDQGVRIVNMSLVTDFPDDLEMAVDDAAAAGALLVAAAGNTGGTALQYPAGFPEVISVGNTNASDVIAPSSTHNNDVELSAPGTSIVSTWKGNSYSTLTGTSMATPVVAGTAAVVWKLHPAFTAQQVRNKLDASVDDLGAAGRDQYYGFGRINLCTAAGGTCDYTPGATSTGSIAGTVKDTGGQPVKARVAVQTGPTAASTRASAGTGEYSLTNLQAGSYTVRAKKRGCTPQTKPVTVSANATATLSFTLTCN